MKPWLLSLMVITVLILACLQPVMARDPFTGQAESRQDQQAPSWISRQVVRITLWQQHLRQKMSGLIRQARSGHDIKPLFILMALAFAYGLLHSAGPGHGKGVAAAYALSRRVTIAGGLLFGFSFAFIHGFSGAVAVLGLRFLIEQTVSGTMATVTTTTQIISFSLITLLGLGLFVKTGLTLLKKTDPAENQEAVAASGQGLLAWAATIGIIPCPAVVMVMLFCLSMEVLLLGLLLAACISLGMAVTVSGVMITVILGRTGALRLVSGEHVRTIERTVGLLSGAAITVFGLFFLTAVLLRQAA